MWETKQTHPKKNELWKKITINIFRWEGEDQVYTTILLLSELNVPYY